GVADLLQSEQRPRSCEVEAGKRTSAEVLVESCDHRCLAAALGPGKHDELSGPSQSDVLGLGRTQLVAREQIHTRLLFGLVCGGLLFCCDGRGGFGHISSPRSRGCGRASPRRTPTGRHALAAAWFPPSVRR